MHPRKNRECGENLTEDSRKIEFDDDVPSACYRRGWLPRCRTTSTLYLNRLAITFTVFPLVLILRSCQGHCGINVRKSERRLPRSKSKSKNWKPETALRAVKARSAGFSSARKFKQPRKEVAAYPHLMVKDKEDIMVLLSIAFGRGKATKIYLHHPRTDFRPRGRF
jgi:hypothetical protein